MTGIKGPGTAAEFLIDRLGNTDPLKQPDKRNESLQRGDGGVPFSEVLQDRIGQVGKKGELKFSAHAQARMASRGIDLSPDEMVRLQEAVGRVRDKGAKESLILTDRAAFVVSVKNDTVITAVDRESLKDNIFTNIDSTVLL